MARAIVRFSLVGDNSTTSTYARNMLEEAGFHRIGTSSFEAESEVNSLLEAIASLLLDHLRSPRGGGQLGHLWVYVDEARPPAAGFSFYSEDE